MRIALVTDAWLPQTNGVVTTLRATAAALERLGHETRVISPQGLRSIACPSYPEIRLALAPRRQIARQIAHFRPHAIHIATEGPVGMAARRHCIERKRPFTTSYHTRYPEYLRARWPIPLAVTYAWLRSFHSTAARTFVSNEGLRTQLEQRRFRNLHIWRRGVDVRRFAPVAAGAVEGLAAGARPLMAYMGRVAVEKNLEAFLRLKVPGTKLIIGDGPRLQELRARYPDAVFAGYKFGQELVQLLSAADVFVFPSLTDTFGLAMIEALACGVPVAAFPVPGPLDVIEHGVTGVLHSDLAVAIQGALQLDRQACVERAGRYTWEAATDQFLAGLAPIRQAKQAARSTRRLVPGVE